uniref:Leucine-rich repeat-containing protein 51 n=1 Tax=Cyprinus carpio TaxID=7962 RepID=A0A8C2GC02_CYPCA
MNLCKYVYINISVYMCSCVSVDMLSDEPNPGARPLNTHFTTSVLTQLKELRLLYLHGNRICKLSEVDKLAALPFLHTITLHGNPIVTEREYRYAKCEKALPPLVDFAILGTTKSPEFCDLRERDGL